VPAYLIRLLDVDHLPACAAIDRPCAGPARAWSACDFFTWLGAPAQAGLVALWERQVVGFLLYTARPGRNVGLHRIGIAPRWRRRRVGSQLLRHLGQWAHAVAGLPLLALVHERDLPMQCFLRANGLRAVRVCPQRCGDDDAYLFAALPCAGAAVGGHSPEILDGTS